MLGGEVVMGGIVVSWGNCGALALIGMVVFGSSSIFVVGSSLGDIVSFGGELEPDFGLSVVLFFLPSPKNERLPLP